MQAHMKGGGGGGRGERGLRHVPIGFREELDVDILVQISRCDVIQKSLTLPLNDRIKKKICYNLFFLLQPKMVR